MTLPTLTARCGFQLSFVPFPLGALIRQRRQRELQRLHLLVHHACKVTCHAGQAHRLADRRVAALPRVQALSARPLVTVLERLSARSTC
jgi:hypothetical protein